jgi:hypothetical protein
MLDRWLGKGWVHLKRGHILTTVLHSETEKKKKILLVDTGR